MSDLLPKNISNRIDEIIAQFDNETGRKIRICLEKAADLPAVRKIIIFGSRAKGTYKEDSDLDVAVFFDREQKDILSCYSELVRLANDTDIDIQIQAFPFSDLSDEYGIIGEITGYGVTFFSN